MLGNVGVGFGFMARTIFRHLLVRVGCALGLVFVLVFYSESIVSICIAEVSH